MKPNDFFRWRTLLVALFLLLALQADAAQFVELTAEIEGQDWGYHLFEDRLIKERDRPQPDTLFLPPRAIRCVVGTNLWMMEDTNGDHMVQWWFTGTKFVEIRKESGRDAVTARNIHESVDGNPGRPVRVVDWMDIAGKSGWLAFCSAPTLKHEGRTIYPTSDLWKEYFAGWKDKTSVFPDDLGLPQSIDLARRTTSRFFSIRRT